jgi:hypothetical protein
MPPIVQAHKEDDAMMQRKTEQIQGGSGLIGPKRFILQRELFIRMQQYVGHLVWGQKNPE